MFSLPIQNIHLSMEADSKQDAITLVAKALASSNYVTSGYLQGMLDREQQTSTYLGNGIAIPHGTLATRHLVKKTGIQLFQFPHGVDWGEGNIVYIVIGIAACSDEHLDLLRQLTHILSNEVLAAELAKTTEIELFRNIFSDRKSIPILCDELITLNVVTKSMLALNAINAGQLQQQNLVDTTFINGLLVDRGIPLGQGLWLSESTIGCKENAIAFSRASKEFVDNDKNIKGVVTISMVDKQLEPILLRLLEPEIQNILLTENDPLLIISSLNGNRNISLLESEINVELTTNDESISAIFTVLNPNGLHARPSTILVQEAKKFSCSITAENLDRATEAVNAKSMMKIVSLGAMKGHQIRFVAKGSDAQLALETIGKAIASGLGEIV